MHAAWGNETPAGESLGEVLAERVAALDDHGLLQVTEVASDGLIRWVIRRDQNGSPRARFQPTAPWPKLSGPDGMLDRQRVRGAVRAEDGGEMLIACTSPGGPAISQAMMLLPAMYPDAPVFHSAARLDELIRQATENSALTKWYELVIVRRAATGALSLGGRQLFPIGARRGDRWPFEIGCEPADGQRTVFAVVAIEPVRQFRLVSVHSARLNPGRYRLNAALVRPGVVRFDGLPARLLPEDRNWPELVASVPDRLVMPRAVHLICAVEISGTREQVLERLSRVSQLIRRTATDGRGELAVSVVAYGPHAFGRGARNEPPETLLWGGSTEAAMSEVGRLRERAPAEPGYPLAAALECALSQIADQLGRDSSGHGRPVLVTVGSRQPFPGRVDPASEILPCPRRADWRVAFQRLRAVPDIAFGAIGDSSPADGSAWACLGSTAAARMGVFDASSFAARLGMLSPAARHVPFPIVDEGRS